MLRLEGISARRGEFVLEADLEVARGGHLSLIGPSGGGKSTTLDVIAGFLTPEAGRVLIDGREITRLGPADRPVAMLFQEHNLFPHLDAAANVGLGINPNLRLSATDRDRIDSALAEVGLDRLGPRRPVELSGGQRQRVAIARALLRDRPVLLLDEPFAALGPAQRAEMLDLIARLRVERSLTVVMVTHSPDDAARAGGGLSIVADGRVSAPQNAVDLLADPPPELAAYLGGD